MVDESEVVHPSSPCPVAGLVSGLHFPEEDTGRSGVTEEIQETISGGKGKIRKFSGICEGNRRCTVLVV